MSSHRVEPDATCRKCTAPQVALVEFCIEADDLKQAVAAGRRFGLLDDAFPTLERAYKSRTIGKLAGKRQWAVAAAVVGEDAQLQVRRVQDHSQLSVVCDQGLLCSQGLQAGVQPGCTVLQFTFLP
jgi:hypothetical protein